MSGGIDTSAAQIFSITLLPNDNVTPIPDLQVSQTFDPQPDFVGSSSVTITLQNAGDTATGVTLVETFDRECRLPLPRLRMIRRSRSQTPTQRRPTSWAGRRRRRPEFHNLLRCLTPARRHQREATATLR